MTQQQEKVPVNNGLQPNAGSSAARAYRPNVDIADTAEELLIEADMPGSSPEQISVHFENGVLTLKAEVPARGEANTKYLAKEYGVANFFRRFEIHEQINPEGISATYRAGVLTVRLPKAEAAKPRRIPVKAVH